MTNLRDYDRDATLIEKVQYLERQLADARASLDIAYAKGLADGRTERNRQMERQLADAQAVIERLRGAMMADDDRLYEAGKRVGLAMLAAAPSVPDGWQLVPVEPTKAMCNAGERVRRYDKHNNDEFMPDIVYASMLAAAPKPGDE